MLQDSADRKGDCRTSLRTVGIVLIVVGVLDIGWMVYCVRARMGYSSSLNIFAVIAGILLCRGSLRAARVVALFGAFFFSGFLGLPVLLLLTVPADLIWAYVRLRPLIVAETLLALTFILVLSAWVYRRLTAPAVLAAMDEQQIEYRRFTARPSTGFLAGIALLLILLVLSSAVLRGAGAQRAKAEARKEVGEGYKLFVSSLSSRSAGGRTTVEANVTAYNRDEIRSVRVTWQD